MNFSKLLFLGTLCYLFGLTSYAQQKSENYDSPMFFNAKIGLGVGLGSVELPFDEYTVTEPYGGGFVIEIGLGYYLAENLSAVANIGYAVKFSYNSHTSTYGGSSTNSTSFAKLGLRGGLQYEIITNQNAKMKGFRIGTGFLFENPGGYSMTVDSEDYGTIDFESNFGYYVEVGMPIHFSKKFKLIPFLRYNSMKTTYATAVSGGNNINGSSIDFGASIDLHL